MFMKSLFLPVLMVISLFSCRTDATDDPIVNELETPTWKYLALGDSYTIGESVPEAERWPVVLTDRLRAAGGQMEDAEIIATTGWTTGNLISAIEFQAPAEEYDLVSLLIGVNNQFQGRSLEEYRTEFTELLQTSIRLAKGNASRVFVVSIPDYGYTPFGQNNQEAISAEIDIFNAACQEITESFGIKYFNITPISREAFDGPGYVAPDGLHPSGYQYSLWVDLMYEEVKEMLLP